SVIPHLNDFGAAFAAYGDRIPGVAPGLAVPFSAKVNVLDSSDHQGDGPDGAGLPKAIVDEVELFTTGGIGTRGTYFVEQYAVDGGEHGLTRDAWVFDHVNPWDAHVPVSVEAGSFTLSLPVDPETFRDSYQDYSVFTQAVGANPFTFFDPKIGVRVGVGNPLHGLSGNVFAGPGHDRQSGLATPGTDTMAFLQQAAGRLVLSGYRYDGERPTLAGLDAFQRTGFGFVYNQWGRVSSETVLQTGWDSNCGTFIALGCASSGGFSQLRYAFNRKLFASGRYEGSNDPTNGFTRDAVLLLGYGPSERSRLTIEDVIEHVPQTRHILNIQGTIAY
ncbi:MAG TPA: hypothetical protein VGD50_02650, partial [Candidatus Baltobacteraceae bacterium]